MSVCEEFPSWRSVFHSFTLASAVMPYLVLRYGPQVTRVLMFWYTFFRMVRVAQEYGLFVTLARIRGGRLTLIRLQWVSIEET